MITVADAMDIMLMVQACHRRTAPRMDDEQVAIATATIWAEVFNQRPYSKAELEAAVKARSVSFVDAPEPAEIIQYASKKRRDDREKYGPTEAYEILCESKAEDCDELAAARASRAICADATAEERKLAIEQFAKGFGEAS